MKTRQLRFPETSVGELVDGRFKHLPRIADALGQVTVLNRPKLILRLTTEAAGQLDFLAALPPDGLYGIHFGFTRLLDSDLGILGSLKGLRFLDLSNTGISNDGLLAICNGLPSLRSICIGETRVTDFALRDMPRSRSMRVFLSCGRKVSIGDKGAHGIGNKMPGLLKLDLSHTDITDEGARGVNHLALRLLNIGMNRITDVGVAHIGGMNSLRILSLHNTLISDAALYFLRSLDNLEFLDLSGTTVGAEGLTYISALPRLSVLLADSMKLSEKTAVVLTKMTQLRTLSLGQQYDSALLTQVRDRLSDCKVIAQV